MYNRSNSLTLNMKTAHS